MMVKLYKSKWLIYAFCIYFAGVAFYAYKNQIQSQNIQYERIDNQLTHAFTNALNTLHIQLKDNISGDKPISTKQDYDIAIELQKIADLHNVKYIYTMVREGNDILFISSNPTKEELLGQVNYERSYKTVYDEADIAIHHTFDTMETHITEYEDRWGRFYAIFTPLKDSNDKTYVMGVDILIEDVNSALKKASNQSLRDSIILALLIIPIILTCLYYLYKFRNAKERWLYTNNKTMLPNSLKLSDDIENITMKRLMFIRIENYDSILHARGSIATDNIIREFSQRLINFEYPSVELTPYHIQDNTFALLTFYDPEKTDTKDAATQLFNRLVKMGYGTSGESSAHVTVRIGSVITKGDALALANMALSEAKTKNITNIIYEDGVHLPDHHINDLSHYTELVSAIKEKRIVPFYQPVFRVEDKQIEKYEALARIIDKDYNIVMNPGDFLPIAYNSRLCHQVTRQILDHAILDIENNATQGFSISINVSIKDFQDKDTLNYIYNTLKKKNVGQFICFEILENQKIEDYKQVNKAIERIRSLGCQVGLDNMGKHYSNFDRLFNMPLDFLKIDGEIISYIYKNKDALQIIKEIISFAQQRNLTLIAEHCDDEETYKLIKTLGIELIQGFYMGKPKPLNQES